MKAEVKWFGAAIVFVIVWTLLASVYLDKKTDIIREALLRDFRMEAVTAGAARWTHTETGDKFVWRRCTVLGWRG